MKPIKTVSLLLTALLAAPLALASTQDEVEPEHVGEELPTEVSAPLEMTANGIPYRTGGAGSDEREALTSAARDYPLKVVFAHKGESDFVAQVSVAISDPKGKKVFEAADTGPWLFVKLPSGKYRVAATLNGQTLEQTASIGGGQKQIAFYW